MYTLVEQGGEKNGGLELLHLDCSFGLGGGGLEGGGGGGEGRGEGC